MSITQKYRSSKSWKEIIKIVQKSSELEGNFIWQTSSSERLILSISKIEVLAELNVIKLIVESDEQLNAKLLAGEGQKSSLDKTLNLFDETYLKLAYRESVFKVTIFKIDGNQISILVPDEIKAMELRKSPRKKFKPKDEKMATMSLTINLTSNAQASLQFQVIDLSETGMSIVVSDKNLELIHNASKFLLEKLGESQLTFKVPAQLVYSHRLRYRYRKAIIRGNRVGFKFLDKIDKKELEKFLTSYG